MDRWSAPEFCHDAISSYCRRFGLLKAPCEDKLTGRYLALFIGPAWLRFIAPKLLPLGGLPGWAGKSFTEHGGAINLLEQNAQLREQIPMVRAVKGSCIDGNDALVLTYDSRAPIMLRRLVDELRALDDDTLLGLTHMNFPLLKRFSMPFLLRRIKH